MNLSKTRYTRGVQCPKMLWLDEHMPEKFDDSVLNESILETGNNVGDLAMGYFGPFVEIPFDPTDFEGMAARTRELIEEGVGVICEATFCHGGDVCMVDILRVEQDGFHLVEVKSSTRVHDIHYHDMAFQCDLLRRCGYEVKSFSLMHVDNGYVFDGELDVKRLFAVEDCTKRVFALASAAAERGAYFKAVAAERVEPGSTRGAADVLDVACPAKLLPLTCSDAASSVFACGDERDAFSIGPHCKSPYPCGYRDWCWRDVEHPSVFDLGGMGLGKAFKLAREGVVSFDDVISSGLPLKAIPARQVEAYRTGARVVLDASSVRRHLASFKLPLYFLDFETFQPALPLFSGTRPYQQIPTQYSLHIIRDANAQVKLGADPIEGVWEHREFLAEAGVDPRRGIAESLVRDIPANACAVAYNMGFERAVLKDLAEAFDDLSEHLLAVRDNMVDLIVPFRNGSCYAAAQNGSFSIKAVLPVLFPDDPDLNYRSLEGVHDGAQASATFTELAGMEPDAACRARANLLRYCELDTLAMVRIWQWLEDAVARAGESEPEGSLS